MIFPKLPRWALPTALSVSLGILSTTALSNEFADDFSSDSIRFSANTFDGSSGVYSVTPATNGLTLSTNATNTTDVGSVFINIQDNSDNIGMDFTHLSTSNTDEGAYINAFLEASLYSDTPNSSLENTEGTIVAGITFGYDQNQTPGAFYCLHREDANGFQTEITDACGQFDGAGFAMDEKAALDIKLDTNARQVIFSANGVSRSIDISGEVHSPAYQFKRIQLYSDGGTANAEATLHAVRLGAETIDMATNPPVLDRYSTNFEPGTTATLVNEKLAVTAVSDINADFWANAELYMQQPTDYLEAELTLASSSDVSEPGYRAWAGISSNFFNTEADGGIDGRLGDVRAEINMEAGGDGLRRMEVCFFRNDDAQGDARSGLFNPDNPGNRCDNLPMILEFDTPYRVALGLDRDASEFVIKVNGYTRTVPLYTEFFAASDSYARISIASRNGGIATGAIDNIRTAPTVLTTSEQATGLTAPAAFPPPIDLESLAVDSTVVHAFDFSDTQPQLDFVDDFSGISSDFGFWSGRDRGQSGVSWDGTAIVFETNSADDNDDGNWTEFYLDPRTDTLEAIVSLSGDTRLPVDGYAGISIRAIFYNDTQDYGFNDQEGDVQASIELEVEGNGRKRVKARLRKRDADGNSTDDLLDSIAAFEDGFNSTVPALDQAYKLSLSIDRINGTIRFGLDDEITEFQIPTGIFLAAQPRALISLNHGGSSGVAIGRIHSVKTDSIDEDFSLAAPEIAPYRPTFNEQYPGRSVEVVDGRLRLEADGTLSSGRDPRIVALKGSDYVGATIELSSESNILPDGTVLIGVSGTMYNDLPTGQTDETGQEGNTFVALRMTAKGDGQRYIQTCAWRSNDSDFGDATDLLSGSNETCARFPNVTPEFDTAYPAFIELDRTAATLTFGFNGETVVYNITTSINATQPFHGVRARTSDGSKVVAWADDLSFAENPVSLADSANILAVDTSNSTTDDTGGTDGNSGSSSSGGGSFAPGLLLLGLLALIHGLSRRHHQTLVTTRFSQRMFHVSKLILCAALLHGCATTTTTSPDEALPYLDQEAITAHITGKTETWSKGAGYYASNGDLAVVWEGKAFTGSWRTTEERELCVTVEAWGSDEDCHRYQLKENEVRLVYKNKAVKRETVDGNQLDKFM